MPDLRIIVTCVDFADFLALTLPWNRHHWKEVVVLTSHHDEATVKIAKANGASVYQTDAFYFRGAKFNKFMALEECINFFGRHGVMGFVDADIFWPKRMPYINWCRGYIYSFKRRRLLYDVTAPIPPERE